jgi:glutamate-1-semialdehyde 2,1-aminomutase
MNRKTSDRLYQQALSLIPGGVNSPVRACRSVGGDPLFIQSAEGSRIVDVDGNTYIDYVGSWGPMILGHRHPAVLESIRQALEKGTSFGAPTQLEVELADMVVEAVPSVEAVRMVNSGTEATMSAIRLARGVTGREAIVKFDGCYHGHADSLLVEAGSGIATLGIPGSPGVPGSFVAHTYSLPYNDSEAVRQLFQKQGSSIAAVVVEPVAGNMGLVEPAEGFLETLREECSRSGSLLVFDEVMTGFRVAYGGAQSLYNITPDLTCFGKIIGGGLPVGAYGGRKDIMQQIAPSGPIYQAGTLSGNPVAMAAGIATLREIKAPGFYSQLEEKSRQLAAGLQAAAEKAGKKVCLNRVGSMMGIFFTPGPVCSFAEAKTSDLDLFSSYYRHMLFRGIYLAPSQFEALFVSAAHSPDDLQATAEAAEASLAAL